MESDEVTSSGPRLQVSGFCDENRFHSFKQETSLTVRLLHSLKGKHDNIIFKLRSPEGDVGEKKDVYILSVFVVSLSVSQ